MASTSTVSLVPMRSPGIGKTRLAPSLGAAERAGLAKAMLADVAAALDAAPVDRIVVVAGGRAAAEVATSLGLDAVLDPPGSRDLNDALAAAGASLGGVDRVLVAAADLPRLSPSDVAAVLDVDAAVVVAPTDDGGTGGLVRRPPDVVPTSYGPGSAARHVAAAQAHGLEVVTLRTPGFAVDVDTIDDLAALSGQPVGPATARWIATSDVDLRRVTG